MFVLQHLRDEAHRFAVSFHRRRRSNLTLRSALGDVPGIGPQRQRLLLRHFGSLKKIREATVEDLATVPGMTAKAAAAVLAHFGTRTPAATVAASSGRSRSMVAAGDGAPDASPADLSGVGDVADEAVGEDAPGDAEEEALESAFAEVEDELDLDGGATDHPEKS